ncbi:hypothetical protein [Burkholderia ubonensis]|uniref:hypothetical protein n=1 Tax=Burkholderia ubonensis TaxID=101571 RepID=UPI000753B005|nr:hypothetical protein [Burkholderia ubonensis]KWN64888.1 hypothetical protein WM23_10835 [Burkholderia ubonensis]
MKLALQDILWHLGRRVPDDGLGPHPDDAFLFTRLLSVLCKCMSVEGIAADDLARPHEGLRAATGAARIGNAAFSAEDIERLRVSLRLTVERDFGLAVEPAQRKRP